MTAETCDFCSVFIAVYLVCIAVLSSLIFNIDYINSLIQKYTLRAKFHLLSVELPESSSLGIASSHLQPLPLVSHFCGKGKRKVTQK